LEAAQNDAQKKNSIKRRLITTCQDEFNDSIRITGRYAEAKKAEEDFRTRAPSLPPSERMQQEADLEEYLLKTKKRMMGNVRFIGELYKKALMSTKIMHRIITSFIGECDDNDEWIGWKQNQSEQDLELLCKLLETVGSILEQKSEHSGETQRIDWYFSRLVELSKDKTVQSRIRFKMEEVIALRKAGWQARREQEGPAKLDEIQQKIVQEEIAKLQQQQSYSQQRMSGSQRDSQREQGSGNVRFVNNYDNRIIRSVSMGPGSQRQGYPNVNPPDLRVPNDYNYQQRHYQGASGTPHNDPQSQYRGGNNDFRRINSAPTGQQPQYGNNQAYNRSSQHPYSQNGPSDQYDDQRGGSRANSQKYYPNHSDSRSPALSREALEGRVRALIREFLVNRQLLEVQDTLRELGSSSYGCFVVEVINAVISSNKPNEVNDLEALVMNLAQDISFARAEVEKSLRDCEALICLSETQVDCLDVRAALIRLSDEQVLVSFSLMTSIFVGTITSRKNSESASAV
jgi:translation initiation factor 4G